MAPTPDETRVHVQDSVSSKSENGEAVVISGISGIFPKSDNMIEFLKNLYNKVDLISEEDLNFRNPEAPKHLGKINGINKFDAQFFRVTYTHGLAMEPMSRKLLEQAYLAMYDSGINPLAYKGKKVGVFIGNSYSDTSNVVMYNSYKQRVNILSGCGKSMFSNRISYWIDAKGPSYTLDCSCASSMVCLEHAYAAMTLGECEAAVVGGCNLCLDPNIGLNLSRSGMLCLDGKTKCFDKNADGCVRSEAISCIFLQKAKDAKRIYAEVCFAQVEYGLKEDAQFLPLHRKAEDIETFLKDFYSKAGVSPKEIEYVEADSSANAEADANELTAIGKVFAEDQPVKVGSVKSNMGHSESASGVCAVTKVCLAYHEGKLPGNLHYSEPTDVTALKEGKIQVVQDNEPFKRGYSAVNNFSITGTNCHVLLKGHYKPKDISKYKSNIPRLVLISGRKDESVEKIINILKNQPIDPEVIGMMHNIYKIDTPGHTSRGYTILDTNEKNETVCLAQNADYYSGAKRPLWLVFSGMGSQWPGMAADLMRIHTFANAIHICHNTLKPLGYDLIRVLTDPEKTMFDSILNCFVGISAVQIGLTDVLKEIGVVPHYVIGHSQGEMGCAYFDNCFTTEDMILAAYSRGYVSATTKFIKGAMAAVGLRYKDILPLCPPEIDVACHNSNESSTISGPIDTMQKFVADLTAKGIFAREVPSTNIAFHSRYIANAGPDFLKRMKAIIKDAPLRSEKWICTSLPPDRWDEPLGKYGSAEYYTNNLLSPVYFEEGIKLIPNNAVVVEVAPHGLLQAILKRSHPECTHIPLTKRGTTDQVKFLFEAFGKLYQEGYNLNTETLYPKIEYPVATETQLISHYVDWEHSEEWPQVLISNTNIVTAVSREFIMSVHDNEFKYFSGYIREGMFKMLAKKINRLLREGNNVFPESATLFLVWETLAMSKGVNYKDISVSFLNIQFFGEAIIKTEESLRLKIVINKGDNCFEVSQNDVLLATGYIVDIQKSEFRNLKKDEQNDEDEIILNSDDIYKHLHVKGLTYKGKFQSIQSINYKRHTTSAQIEWTDNWITFIDSLIQLNVLARDHDGVSRPKVIKRIDISVDDHLKEPQEEITDGETYFNAEFNSFCGVTRCGGVEMRNIIFDDKAIKEQHPEVIETQSFVPYSTANEVNITTAIQIALQIVADNTQNDTITVTEFVNETTPSLSHIFNKAGLSISNVNLNIQTIDIENINKNLQNSTLVVLQDVFKNGMNLYDISKELEKNAFILAIGNNLSDSKNGTFNIISSMVVEKKQLVLLKKIEACQDNMIFIPVDNDNNFGWVATVESELQKTKRIVLVCERKPHCGLIGFVRKLREEHGNKISLVVIDDYNAPTFDQNNIVYKEQLHKKLTYNIFQKGQWGSYLYLPNLESINVKNFKLVNSSGDINSLKWSEAPTLPSSDNLVQVCYAGTSIRDVQKAVGVIENVGDGFGFDFSGFDSKGDRVMGLIFGGALASSVQADPDLLWPVPQHWTLEEAATVPLPFVHAFYLLAVKHQLLKGHSVFVNGGAGALGQAVISICSSLNCTVYTSVSDVQKKRFLLELFPQLYENNIGCTRNGSFYSMVLLTTKGKGCDFVINCASGAAREAGMKCVARNGIFLDVNSYDFYQNSPLGMSYIGGDRTYAAANLSSIFKPENSKEKKMLQMLILQGIISNTIKPLTRIVLSATDVSRAFRLLSSNKHRGRVLIRIRDGDVPIKCLNILPRATFSSEGTYIVLCDQTELGVELANRFVQRGAKKIMLHLKYKNVPGYLHIKFLNWMKLGTTINISTEDLNSDRKCVQLLKDAEKMGKVHGLFIIQESSVPKTKLNPQDFVEKYNKNTSIVAHMDVLTRNNCSELSYFVVISRSSQNAADEYMTSVCDKICEARLGVGLPGLTLKVGPVDELHSNLHYNERLEPQTITTVLNALETSLKRKQGSVRTYNMKGRSNTEFLDKVAKCLGIADIDEVKETLTVHDLTTNEINLEQLKTVIKETFKVEYTIDKVKQFSIASLKSLHNPRAKQNAIHHQDGLGQFYSFVDPDEYLATDFMIQMHTIINKNTETNEFDENEAHLMLIPGFEGHHQIFKPICERLKIRAMTFQLGPDLVDKSIQEMAINVVKYIKKSLVFKSKFYLLGYSFGVNVALEVAALLEKEGHVGIVYCLDSSPSVLQWQLDTYIGKQTDNQLQNLIIKHMFRIMSGQESEALSQGLEGIENWVDKVEVCVNSLKKIVTYTSQYTRNVLESAYKRILLVRDYKPEFKLNSELVLFKGTSHHNTESFGADYGLSKLSTKPVKVFEIATDHATALQDCRVSNIINNLLDPALLEEFKNKNLCETYFVDI